jgi:hypothetical protein
VGKSNVKIIEEFGITPQKRPGMGGGESISVGKLGNKS